MSLPKDFLEEFLPLMDRINILGNPLHGLTKKELQATVVFLISDIEEKKQQMANISITQAANPWGREH